MTLCRVCPTKSPQWFFGVLGSQFQVIDFEGFNWWAH